MERRSSFNISLRIDDQSNVTDLIETESSEDENSRPPYDDNEMEARYETFLKNSRLPENSFRSLDYHDESSEYSSEDEGFNSDELDNLRGLIDSSLDGTELQREARGTFEATKKNKQSLKPKEDVKKSEIWSAESSRYICRYKDCRRICKTPKTLKRHQFLHSDMSREFVCLICTVRCLSRRSLKAHYTINHSGRKIKFVACRACYMSKDHSGKRRQQSKYLCNA